MGGWYLGKYNGEMKHTSTEKGEDYQNPIVSRFERDKGRVFGRVLVTSGPTIQAWFIENSQDGLRYYSNHQDFRSDQNVTAHHREEQIQYCWNGIRLWSLLRALLYLGLFSNQLLKPLHPVSYFAL
jgi:hypothetical protein